jgi:hypothetical protein
VLISIEVEETGDRRFESRQSLPTRQVVGALIQKRISFERDLFQTNGRSASVAWTPASHFFKKLGDAAKKREQQNE